MELIFYEDDWADEMGIHCIHIVPIGFYDQFIKAAEALYDTTMESNKSNYRTSPSTLDFYVGTNEEVQFSRESFRARFTKTEVALEDIDTLKKYLNFKSFGNNVMSSILDYAGDELPLDFIKSLDVIITHENWSI